MASLKVNVNQSDIKIAQIKGHDQALIALLNVMWMLWLHIKMHVLI